MALIPKSLFPDVPKLPGVPQVRRALGVTTRILPVVLAAAAVQRLIQAFSQKPRWGIYRTDPNDSKKLTPVLSADSVLTFGYRNESRVSDFPVQNGAFASYNKVANPFEIPLRFSKGGTKEDRAALLNELDVLLQSLELYTVITPEKTYSDCNVVSVEISREQATGAYFLADIDVTLRQIRQVTPQYSSTAASTQNAQDAGAKPDTNQGKRQVVTTADTSVFNPANEVGPIP